MVQPVVSTENDEESSLLLDSTAGDVSWRLNFDGFQLSPEHKEKKPSRPLHDCLGVLSNFQPLLPSLLPLLLLAESYLFFFLSDPWLVLSISYSMVLLPCTLLEIFLFYVFACCFLSFLICF